jgi:hypothetical protein
LDNLRSMNSGGYNIQEGSVIHIVNGGLRVETLSTSMIKKYLSNARDLINSIEKLVKNDYGAYTHKS